MPTEGVRTKRVSPVAASAIAQSTGVFDPFPLPVRNQNGLTSSQSPAVSFLPPGRFGGCRSSFLPPVTPSPCSGALVV